MNDKELYSLLVARAAKYFNVTELDIRSRKRTDDVAKARHAIWYYLWNQKNWGGTRILRASDHPAAQSWGTINAGVKSFQDRIDLGQEVDPVEWIEEEDEA